MGYFNKEAYSYPRHGASAEKPPVAPASNQYITYTRKERQVVETCLSACLPISLSTYLSAKWKLDWMRKTERMREEGEREREREKDSERKSYSARASQKSPVAAAADITCDSAAANRCVLILDDCSLRAPSIRSHDRYHFRYARICWVKYAISHVGAERGAMDFFSSRCREHGVVHRQINPGLSRTICLLSAKRR